MARIPKTELTRLKATIPLAVVVPAYGVELKPHGAADLVARCPFHSPDKTPSFVITPRKNLFRCFGCGAAGSVIDFVMRIEQIEFLRAVEILQTRFAPAAFIASPDQIAIPDPHRSDFSDPELLADVLDYYRTTFQRESVPQEYMKSRGLDDAEMLEHFKIGFSNRTLGFRLPAASRQYRSHDLRARLKKLGVLRPSGVEIMAGSVVVPIFDENGLVAGMYGRKITQYLRTGTPTHVYLGPHRAVWNVDALKASTEIILTEALLDALSFWRAGFRNVTSAYGVEGFTEHHLSAFKKYGTKRVLIAFDADEAGNRGAEKVAAKLRALGIPCFRIELPAGMDANDYMRRADEPWRSHP